MDFPIRHAAEAVEGHIAVGTARIEDVDRLFGDLRECIIDRGHIRGARVFRLCAETAQFAVRRGVVGGVALARVASDCRFRLRLAPERREDERDDLIYRRRLDGEGFKVAERHRAFRPGDALREVRDDCAARLVSRENFFVETAPFVFDPGRGQIVKAGADDNHDTRVDDGVLDGVFIGGLAELEECHIAEKGIDTGVFESRIKCLRNPAVRRALTARVIILKGYKRIICHACFPFLVLCHIFFTVRLYTHARNVSIMPATFSRFSH